MQMQSDNMGIPSGHCYKGGVLLWGSFSTNVCFCATGGTAVLSPVPAIAQHFERLINVFLPSIFGVW